MGKHEASDHAEVVGVFKAERTVVQVEEKRIGLEVIAFPRREENL
jgi:hypothetical protein